jgi:hypothetical protein
MPAQDTTFFWQQFFPFVDWPSDDKEANND